MSDAIRHLSLAELEAGLDDRGINAHIVSAGDMRVGDVVRKI